MVGASRSRLEILARCSDTLTSSRIPSRWLPLDKFVMGTFLNATNEVHRYAKTINCVPKEKHVVPESVKVTH